MSLLKYHVLEQGGSGAEGVLHTCQARSQEEIDPKEIHICLYQRWPRSQKLEVPHSQEAKAQITLIHNSTPTWKTQALPFQH